MSRRILSMYAPTERGVSSRLSLASRLPFRVGAASAALIFSLVGCTGTSTPITQPPGPTAEEQRLQKRLVEMEQRAIMGEVESRRLKGEVERLEAELAVAKEQAQHTAPTAAPSTPIGDGIGTITVTPLVEAAELEEPVEVLAEPSASGTAPTTSGPFVVGGTVVALESTSAQEIYDQGYALFHQRRYDEAEYVFGQVLARHGGHELADNALFWIGESRYAQGRYDDALAAFTGTVERYPEGNKVGDAMLKAGKCLEATGQGSRAAATYEEVRRLFPDSAAAIMAEERLEALR